MGVELSCEVLKRLESMKEGDVVEVEKRSGKFYIFQKNSSEKILCIIKYLNKVTGKNFKEKSQTTRRHIKARLKDGFSYNDFKLVIQFKSAQWKEDPKMNEYLRPSTLFNTKFESYLEAAKQALKKGISPKPHNESKSRRVMNKMLEMENPYA